MINIRGYIGFDIWNLNCNRDSNHLLIELKRNVCDLKLLFLNCVRWTGSALEIIASCHQEMNILDGNIKTVVWSAARPISDLFGKGEPILGSAYTYTQHMSNKTSDAAPPPHVS